jgi:hypothetical protein
VTRGLFPPHLHFGWYDATGMRSYLPSGAMNPYPILRWMVAGGGVLGGGSKARYCEVPRSGAPTPSRGPDHWPVARDPGARPDLDTGTARPAPGPVATSRARTHEPDGPVRAEKPSPANAKASPVSPAKAAQDHRAPEPSTPGKPATGVKPATGARSSPETSHKPAAGQSPGEDP